MIIVTASMRVQPQRRAEAVRLATQMEDASRQEDGCMEYVFTMDREDTMRFFLYERWRDPAALAVHLGTARMTEFQQRISELLAEPLEVDVYEGERVEGLL